MASNLDLINDTKGGFWKMSGPFLVLSFFEAFYAFVDMFWISQMNLSAFFAIGIALPFFTLINNFGKSIGTGTHSVISREIGAKDYEASYNSILHGIIACVVLAVALILTIPFMSDIMVLMNITTSVSLVKQYMIPILLFSFVFLVSNLFLYTLQAEGNSKVPTILLISSNILNLVLDPILIFVFNWGVTGAAFASIISSAAIAVYLFYWYLTGKSDVVLSLKYFRAKIAFDIIIVAVPNMMMDSLICFVSSFINVALLNQLGEMGVVLYSAALKIKDLILAPQTAFAKSMMTVSGQLLGAGKIDRLKSMFRYVAIISAAVTLVLTVLFFFIRIYAFELLSVTGVETYVFYIAFAGIFLLFAMQFSALAERVFAGIGKSYDAMVIEIGTAIFKVLIISVLVTKFDYGAGVLIGILVTESLTALIYHAVFKLIIGKFEREMPSQAN